MAQAGRKYTDTIREEGHPSTHEQTGVPQDRPTRPRLRNTDVRVAYRTANNVRRSGARSPLLWITMQAIQSKGKNNSAARRASRCVFAQELFSGANRPGALLALIHGEGLAHRLIKQVRGQDGARDLQEAGARARSVAHVRVRRSDRRKNEAGNHLRMAAVMNAVAQHGEDSIALGRVGDEALVHILMMLNERCADRTRRSERRGSRTDGPRGSGLRSSLRAHAWRRHRTPGTARP